MTLEAFLFEAFQSGAFQSEAETEIWAFQKCVFQADAFQAEQCDAPPPVVASLGGWGPFEKAPRRKKKEEVEFEQEVEEALSKPVVSRIRAEMLSASIAVEVIERAKESARKTKKRREEEALLLMI